MIFFDSLPSSVIYLHNIMYVHTTYVRTYMCVLMYIRVCVDVCTYMCVLMYVCVCIDVHTCVY